MVWLGGMANLMGLGGISLHPYLPEGVR